MERRVFFGLILLLTAAGISGCGFGGFSDTGSGTSSGQANPSSTDTILKGAVSKGIFKDGSVRVYAVNPDGSKELLRTTPINGFGNYSAHLGATKVFNGSYGGVVQIEATGTYIDEATGADTSTEEPLRSLIANPSGEVAVSVTPLTELAARKAAKSSPTYTADAVTAANTLLSDIFKVDIIATQPVPLTKEKFTHSLTTQAQKDYTLALAAISQMAKGGGLSATINALNEDLGDGVMSVENAAAFQNALKDFLASDKNPTLVKDIRQTNLVNVGGSPRVVKITTTGKLDPGVTINGFKAIVELPQGTTLKASFSDAVYQTLAGVVVASGVVPGGLPLETNYAPPAVMADGKAIPGTVTMVLAGAAGFGLGEIITITCDLAPGTSPPITDFKITLFEATDGNGAIIKNDQNNVVSASITE